jgi:hypothetical protein
LATITFPGRPLAIRRLTVSTAVVTLATAASPITAASVGIPAGAIGCAIQVVTAGVRFAVGEDPTAANGFPLAVGDTLTDIAAAYDLRFIRSGGADATLEIVFYG